MGKFSKPISDEFKAKEITAANNSLIAIELIIKLEKF